MGSTTARRSFLVAALIAAASDSSAAQQRPAGFLHKSLFLDRSLPVYSLATSDGALWAATGIGLYKIAEMDLNRYTLVGPFGYPVNVVAADERYLWTATDCTVERRRLSALQVPSTVQLCPRLFADGSKITAIEPIEDKLWITAKYSDPLDFENRAYLQSVTLEDYSVAQRIYIATPREDSSSASTVKRPIFNGDALHWTEELAWISAPDTVVGVAYKPILWADRFDHGLLAGVVKKELPLDGVRDLTSIGGNLWLGTPLGLFWCPASNGTCEPLDYPTVSVNAVQAFAGFIWFGTDQGLFRLRLLSSWDARIEIHHLQRNIEPSKDFVVTWSIKNFFENTLPEVVEQSISIRGSGIEREQNVARREPRARSAGEFSFSEIIEGGLPEGRYRVTVEASDLLGNTSRSLPQRFSVGETMAQVLLMRLKQTGQMALAGYALLNVLGLVGLALGARWSETCLSLLFNPGVQKYLFAFRVALPYVPPLRIWVLDYYFRRMKQHYILAREPGPYVPGVVRRADGTTLSTDWMLEEMQSVPQLLVKGHAGAGKTIMITEMLRTYLRSSNLRQALRLYGVLPVYIPLRQWGTDTVLDAAGSAFRAVGFPVPEGVFFRVLLERSSALLLLDGMNEASEGFARQIPGYAKKSSKVRLLITSQTSLPRADLPEYTLPAMSPEFAEILLKAFLGTEGGMATAKLMGPALGLLKSGYDVRLVADLVEEGRVDIPQNRAQLYEMGFDSCVGADYPRHVITRRAWAMWKTDDRQFSLGGELTEELIEPLISGAGPLVVRRGDRFEFRHDLIREYLAAVWIARYAPTFEVTMDYLREGAVWAGAVTREMQTEMFGFLCDLLDSPEMLVMVAQVAVEDLGRRQVLLRAAQERARSKGWGLKVDLASAAPAGSASREA